MKKALMNSMRNAFASAACADAASACAHTAAFRAVMVLDAIAMASIIIFTGLVNCALAVLGIQGILVVLAVLLVCGTVNPSEARKFA